MLEGLLCPSLPPRSDQIELALDLVRETPICGYSMIFIKNIALTEQTENLAVYFCLLREPVAQAMPENNVEPDKLYNASRVSLGTH